MPTASSSRYQAFTHLIPSAALLALRCCWRADAFVAIGRSLPKTATPATAASKHQSPGLFRLEGAHRGAERGPPRLIAAPLLRSAANSKADDDNDNDGDEEDGPADVRMFLNQVSIQSLMFLLTQTRDPHTIRWPDDFTRPTMGPYGEEEDDDDDEDQASEEEAAGREWAPFVINDKKLSSKMLHYHGLSAMNTTLFPTWDSYFLQLLEQPPREIIVESNNPLVREFTVDIDPASLCSRILSVRSQIAREWVKDLDVIAEMGGRIFYSYWDNLEREREEQGWRQEQESTNGESDESSPSSSSVPSPSSSRGGGPNWVRTAPLSSTTRSPGYERQSLTFLEWDPNSDGGGSSEIAPSPLRKGNFDLLVLLATQESVRRVLAGGTVGIADEASNKAGVEFLKTFYEERRDEMFSRGSGRYGRADDFLEELMLSPPLVVVTPDPTEEGGGRAALSSPGLVDPLRIAEVVVLERERVAEEWAEAARSAPGEHAEIRRLQMDRMMMGSSS